MSYGRKSGPRRVLVTGVGGNVGQGVIKALRAGAHEYHITGVDMEPLSAGFAFTDAHYVTPRTGADGFMEALCRIIKRESAEAIYPCSPSELPFFSENRLRLEEETGASVFVNPQETVKIGADKLATAAFIEKAGFSSPMSARAGDEEGVRRIIEIFGFPLFMKPRFGFTSKDTFLVKSREEINAVRTLVPDSIVQRYLGDGPEYTAGGVSGEDGVVRAIIILRRHLAQGTTYRTELVRDESLRKDAAGIFNRLKAVGSCNLQFKVTGDKMTVFEINARFSGTTGVRYLYGLNDAEMCYDLLRLKIDAGQPELKDAVTLRYWNEVVLNGAAFADLRNAEYGFDGKQVTIKGGERKKECAN